MHDFFNLAGVLRKTGVKLLFFVLFNPIIGQLK